MTSASALRGEGVTKYVTNTTDRLRECVTKGEGVQNPDNFADVILVSPQMVGERVKW